LEDARFPTQGYRHIPCSTHRSGLAQGKTLVLDSMDDLNLVFDLLIHTAPKDRSRAIDRYARAARLAPETDEALVLEAMRRARFSIISSVRRHTVAGLIVKDLFRGFEFWLVDEGLESSLPDEAVLATRLYTLEGFAMTATMAPTGRPSQVESGQWGFATVRYHRGRPGRIHMLSA